MRESIKCRAKNTISGSWVYGYYLLNNGINQIYTGNGFIPVHPQTVGQLIPSIGHNNISCYEGDIIEYQMNKHGKPVGIPLIAYMRFNEYTSSWQLCYWTIGEFWATMDIKGEFLKVIGNIHENAELLKEKIQG